LPQTVPAVSGVTCTLRREVLREASMAVLAENFEYAATRCRLNR
jgi:hypothetical protein